MWPRVQTSPAAVRTTLRHGRMVRVDKPSWMEGSWVASVRSWHIFALGILRHQSGCRHSRIRANPAKGHHGQPQSWQARTFRQVLKLARTARKNLKTRAAAFYSARPPDNAAPGWHCGTPKHIDTHRLPIMAWSRACGQSAFQSTARRSNEHLARAMGISNDGRGTSPRLAISPRLSWAPHQGQRQGQGQRLCFSSLSTWLFGLVV